MFYHLQHGISHRRLLAKDYSVSLISTLKKQHAFLLEELARIQTLGITKEEALPSVLGIKDVLLSHLRLEDDELYPTLIEAAKYDVQVQATVEIFARDMLSVSQLALDFFEKYETGNDWANFPQDFYFLYAQLKIRIQREENTLYAVYESLYVA
jgi:hypothetical protein